MVTSPDIVNRVGVTNGILPAPNNGNTPNDELKEKEAIVCREHRLATTWGIWILRTFYDRGKSSDADIHEIGNDAGPSFTKC